MAVDHNSTVVDSLDIVEIHKAKAYTCWASMIDVI